jgi:CRP-like cAMP-binding protein
MSSIDTKENVLLSKLAVIDEFSVEANLNKDLRNKLKHALRYSAEKRGFSWLDKLSIFNELPKQLRYEVAINMHHGAAKEISFFKDKDQSIIASIVPLLQPMFLERNDYVYKKGEFADEIYFIVRGRISYVFGKEDTILKSMQRGSYFGDIEVVRGISRKYAAKGVRSSELLIMHRQVLQEIIDEHPNVWEEIRTVAMERDKLNEKAIIEILELIRLRNNGELEGINVKVFKKKVDELFEKRCQHLHEKHQIYTLKDLANRIDTLTRIIRDGDSPTPIKITKLKDEDLE